MGVEITARCDVCKERIEYLPGEKGNWKGNEFAISFSYRRNVQCIHDNPDREGWSSTKAPSEYTICNSCGKKIENNLLDFLGSLELHKTGENKNF